MSLSVINDAPERGTQALLVQVVNDLIAAFNAHTHTENTAVSYTQNATTAVPTSLFTETIVLKR